MEKWLPLFTALTNLVTIAVVLYIRSSLKEIKTEVAAAAENIKTVEIATNSMKDELVKVTARAAHAEGKEQGREEEENRQDAPPKLAHSAETPVPVKDDRVAIAAEQSAEASKDIARATESMADTAKKRVDKSPDPKKK